MKTEIELPLLNILVWTCKIRVFFLSGLPLSQLAFQIAKKKKNSDSLIYELDDRPCI